MIAVDTHSALGMEGNREALANMIHFNQKTPMSLGGAERKQARQSAHSCGVTPRSEGKHKVLGGLALFRGTCDLGTKVQQLSGPRIRVLSARWHL